MSKKPKQVRLYAPDGKVEIYDDILELCHSTTGVITFETPDGRIITTSLRYSYVEAK